jgi:hypothetical protein
MPQRGSRVAESAKQFATRFAGLSVRVKAAVAGGGVAVLALVVTLAVVLAGGSDDATRAAGPKPPPPSEQPESQITGAPGSSSFTNLVGLREPVTYPDKITVEIADIRYVTNKAKGPGELTGRTLTIFTLRFTNGSAQPLDLNKVRVVARYGKAKREASPTSYANLNDFYGTVAPGAKKSASYAFDLPESGYSAVTLGVKFSETHKTAVFAGSLGR